MTKNKFKRFLFKMDVSKDYYTILGILPSAEILVIKAAHKAMLKIYHPDKFKGTKEESHLKTVDINEAYLILSSKDTKDEYDKLRTKNSNDNFSDEEESSFNSDFSTEQSSKERPIKPYKLLRGVNWALSALFFLGVVVSLANFTENAYVGDFFFLIISLVIFASSMGTAIALNPGVDIIMGVMPIIIHRKSPTVYALLITNSLLGIAIIILFLYEQQYDESIIFGFLYSFLSFANARSLWELKKA